MRGWRPALLIAWRDALRHRGRSALVLVMISLPVLAVSAAAIVIKTSQVEGIEKADRVLGAADARIVTDGRGQVLQAADPSNGEWGSRGEADRDDLPTTEELGGELLGRGQVVTVGLTPRPPLPVTGVGGLQGLPAAIGHDARVGGAV